MSTVEIIKKEISKLTGQSKTIEIELGHRRSQAGAWQSVARAYGSQYTVQKTKGKYWDFGTRKGGGVTVGDYRTSQHYLKKVIPRYITRLTTQKTAITEQIAKKKRSLVF